MARRKSIGFEISVSARDDGTLEAVYIRMNEGKIAKTVEVDEDVVLADYDSQGKLLGIELLAPVRLAKIVKLVDAPRRPSFRKAIKRGAPEEFLVPS